MTGIPPVAALKQTFLQSVYVSSKEEVDEEVQRAAENEAKVAEASKTEDPQVWKETFWTPDDRMRVEK